MSSTVLPNKKPKIKENMNQIQRKFTNLNINKRIKDLELNINNQSAKIKYLEENINLFSSNNISNFNKIIEMLEPIKKINKNINQLRESFSCHITVINDKLTQIIINQEDIIYKLNKL